MNAICTYCHSQFIQLQTMTFNLENTDSDKFDHLANQLKLWSEETEHQIVFLTSDQKKISCSSKVFTVFSELIKDVVNDFKVSNQDFDNPIIISVPLDLHMMTCIYQLLLNGFCQDADVRETIEGAKLLGIAISELNSEPFKEEAVNVFTIKKENDFEVFVDLQVESTSLSEKEFNEVDSTLKKISCTECSRYFFKIKALRKHRKRFHGILEVNSEFACNECGKVYDKKSLMRKHMRRIHGIMKKPKGEQIAVEYHCKECENSYPSRDKLARHEIQHTAPDGKPFDCLICETLFSRKDALTRHRKRKNH